MNIHILLEDISYDTNFKKNELLSKLKEYPLFKETKIEDAEYLIIIPNYPTPENQPITNVMHDIIHNDSLHIHDNKVLLLDSDNTFYILDEDNIDYYEEILHFKPKNHSITDIFGFTPTQTTKATNRISNDLPTKVNEVEVPKKTTKKRRLLLG